MKSRIDVLTACQRDLMDDLSSFRDENSKLTKVIEEVEKENQSLKLKANLHRSLLASPKCPETPEKSQNLSTSLREKLKKAEEYNDQLEAKIFDNTITIKSYEAELNSIKEKLHSAGIREKQLLSELQKDEEEKGMLQQQIQESQYRIKRIEQELDDYRDC